MENTRINHIFAALTIISFILGMLCILGVACGLPTPGISGVYFTISKVCFVAFLITKLIGAIARKEIVL